MDKKALYTQAYDLLNHSTPLKIDCGRLCDKTCCDSREESSGMYLFPGEEVMLSPLPDWVQIKPISWPFNEKEKTLLAVCESICDRDARPLSCRIFPLIPHLTENDILQIKVDPRAALLCPLARHSSQNQLNRDFTRNVRKAFQILIQDEDIKQFVRELSQMLDEYRQLPWSKLI